MISVITSLQIITKYSEKYNKNSMNILCYINILCIIEQLAKNKLECHVV